MKKESELPKGKIVVISDTHFGDENQLLDDSSLVDRLASALASRGRIDELILLGDVFDLWVRTMVPAMRQGRYFIASACRMENVSRILFVPGNHDHLLFLNAFDDEVARAVESGDLTPPRFAPARHYPRTVLGGLCDPGFEKPFSMAYPFVVRKVRDREVVFTHGHHLDFYDASFGWARTFWLSRRIIRKRRRNATLHDIEMANLPFCGAMSVAPWVPELVEGGLRFYRIINFFSKVVRKPGMQHSPRRDTLIKDNYDEIGGLLPLLGHPLPGCFVFGHTHRPGIGKIPGSNITVANAGAWVRPDDEDVPHCTWVEVEHDVKLFRLNGDEPELMFSESI